MDAPVAKMMRLVVRSAAFAVTLLVNGCITLQVGSSDSKKAADWTFPTPAAGFTRLNDVTSAEAYRSAGGSMLGLGSTCDDDAGGGFDPLLASVTAGVPRRTTLERPAPLEGTPLASRATRVAGNLDGQSIEMLAVVLKSERCIYDVTLAGPNLTESERLEALRLARGLRLRSDVVTAGGGGL